MAYVKPPALTRRLANPTAVRMSMRGLSPSPWPAAAPVSPARSRSVPSRLAVAATWPHGWGPGSSGRGACKRSTPCPVVNEVARLLGKVVSHLWDGAVDRIKPRLKLSRGRSCLRRVELLGLSALLGRRDQHRGERHRLVGGHVPTQLGDADERALPAGPRREHREILVHDADSRDRTGGPAHGPCCVERSDDAGVRTRSWGY
jgi:hypothetical protein